MMRRMSRYEQVMQDINEQIEKKELKPNQQIPSEVMLMEQYGVSRNAVREATNNLIINNILYRKKGIGTFVKSPKVSEPLSSKWSIKAELASQGIEITTSYCNIEKLENDPKKYSRYYITRVRDSEGIPIVFSQSYIKTKIRLEDRQQQVENSLYQLLADNNENVAKISDEIELIFADRVVAQHLNVELGTPLLKKTRIGFDMHGHQIEKTFSYYDSKRYCYKVEFLTGEKNEL